MTRTKKKNKSVSLEHKIADILLYGDRASQAEVISALICLDNIETINKIKEKWGDKKFFEVVGRC